MAFITSTDPRWQSLLQETNFDLYHLPGFAAIEAGLIKGEAVAWYQEYENFKQCNITSGLLPTMRRI